MDNQDKQTSSDTQATTRQPQTEQAQPAKPKINMSHDEAQALLAINNLLVPQQPKTKPPVKLIFIAIGLIVFAIIVSSLMGAFKSSPSTKSGGVGLPNQSNPTSGSDVNGQINQDENTCTNPANALTVC